MDFIRLTKEETGNAFYVSTKSINALYLQVSVDGQISTSVDAGGKSYSVLETPEEIFRRISDAEQSK